MGGKLLIKVIISQVFLWFALCLPSSGWAIAAETTIEEKFVALAAGASLFDTEGLRYGHSPFQQDYPEAAKEKSEYEQFQWLTEHATCQETENS